LFEKAILVCPSAGFQVSEQRPDHGERNVVVISAENIVKSYGKSAALSGVTLRVEKGQIYGLLGPNGAGKTTLIRILLGIVKPNGGKAQLLGEPAGHVPTRRRVGYLPEDHCFPDYHTGFSLMEFYAALLELPRREQRRRIPFWLERVGLRERMHQKIRTYSKGMKQRLGIAQALVHDPEVIILDEPTDGVDPLGRWDIRAILQELKADGRTVFLNSHLLSEIERICDRVAILQRGRVVREGDLAELTCRKGLFTFRLAPEQALPEDELEREGYRVSRSEDCWEVAISDMQDIETFLELLRGRGMCVRHWTEKRLSLEDLFMETLIPAKPAPGSGCQRAGRSTRQLA
jgi:ABC-2 type transport system ATP-binding protein